MKNKIVMCSAAVLSLLMALPANAETVTTKTYVQTKNLPDVKNVKFSDFDTNGDGAYSMQEVGDRLFQSFDQDRNGFIDNREWDNKSVMTISPMEKKTFKFVDYNDDGIADESSYTYESFYQASGLIKFDENQNGLSASEFIGVGFQELDYDDDQMINKKEWQEAYMESIRPENAKPERYN